MTREIQVQDGLLLINSEESPEMFVPLISGCEARLQGFAVHVIKDGVPILVVDPVDNTVILLNDQPETIAAAKELGAKRFSMKPLSGDVEGYADDFTRDRCVSKPDSAIELPADLRLEFVEGNLPQVASQYHGGPEVFYSKIATCLKGAGFTPDKQGEYDAGGLADVVCRFNNSGGTMGYVVGYNDKNEIVCVLRMLYSKVSGDIESGYKPVVYFSDESPDALKERYFPPLFAFASECASKKFDGDVHIFIRVANGKEVFYETLGCSKPEDKGAYVIHGPPTDKMKLLTAYLLEQAKLLLADQITAYRDKISAAAAARSGAGPLQAPAAGSDEPGVVPRPGP